MQVPNTTTLQKWAIQCTVAMEVMLLRQQGVRVLVGYGLGHVTSSAELQTALRALRARATQEVGCNKLPPVLYCTVLPRLRLILEVLCQCKCLKWLFLQFVDDVPTSIFSDNKIHI